MSKQRNRKGGKSYKLLSQLIHDRYLTVLNEQNKIPSQREVAEFLGISERTVANHLAHISLDKTGLPLKIFLSDVLLSLRNEAVRGNVAAIKLYLFVLFGVDDKKEPVGTGDDNESQLLEKWLAQGREILRALKNEGKEENSELKNK